MGLKGSEPRGGTALIGRDGDHRELRPCRDRLPVHTWATPARRRGRAGAGWGPFYLVIPGVTEFGPF